MKTRRIHFKTNDINLVWFDVDPDGLILDSNNPELKGLTVNRFDLVTGEKPKYRDELGNTVKLEAIIEHIEDIPAADEKASAAAESKLTKKEFVVDLEDTGLDSPTFKFEIVLNNPALVSALSEYIKCWDKQDEVDWDDIDSLVVAALKLTCNRAFAFAFDGHNLEGLIARVNELEDQLLINGETGVKLIDFAAYRIDSESFTVTEVSSSFSATITS